ncbi:LamG domain-containing protein, partial [candidate division NPL-UPA2 bacterium]|nr:LamG domain-containing protein [candidate division NPL-UPA2 bacterium]
SLTIRGIRSAQALQLAEAGVERAIWELRRHTDWRQEPPAHLYTDEPLGAGSYSVVLGPRSRHRITVTSTAQVKDRERAVQVELVDRGNVVGFWKFDEGEGDVAYDSTREKNHGMIINYADWVPGREGSALRFDDDEEQYVEVPSDPTLNLLYEITLDHWFRTTSPQSDQFMVVKGDPYRYGTYLTNASRTISFYVRLRTRGVQFVSYTRGGGFADGHWHRITGTFDGRHLRIYHQGVLRGTRDIGAEDTITFDDTPLYFARWGENYFRGDLDEIKITDRALLPEDF